MDYQAFHFTVDPPQPGSEILMAMIAELGFDTFEQEKEGFTAYLPSGISVEEELDALQFPDFTFSYTIEKIKETNWNEEWEKNFEPVEVGKLLRIRAPFHPATDAPAMEIIIMPKMSFGTGHHQTTRLMCASLFETELKGTSVLDMGTGTGVLAILARKLGAAHVMAIDNDAWSVENAKENCVVNQCHDISVLEGDEKVVGADDRYDVILANINRNVLKLHLPVYGAHLKKDGHLLMSGFFVTDRQELEAAAAIQGLALVDQKAEEEWCQLRFRKVR